MRMVILGAKCKPPAEDPVIAQLRAENLRLKKQLYHLKKENKIDDAGEYIPKPRAGKRKPKRS